jgi:formylglycine-generating enzyme
MMSKTEVTVKQFREFINSSNYRTVAETGGGSYFYNGASDKWELHAGVTWKNDASGKNLANESHPVLHVSYTDAQEFCSWLSSRENKKYRLPTEAEWEYAAGGGSSHYMYSWGNDFPSQQVSNIADVTFAEAFSVTKSSSNIFVNYFDNYIYTAPVGSFSPNTFGLQDMTGNVKEWCLDWVDWNYYSKSPSLNPVGPSGPTEDNYRAVRGGYWYSKPFATTNYARWGGTINFRTHHIGIRIVAEI